MRLSQTTRKGMRDTTNEMLKRLEALCQKEYSNIEYHQIEITKSQKFLEDKLEPEYIKCRDLLQSIEFKLRK